VDTTLQDPLVGQVLDGRYRIDARIAVGGMATVYRALDTRLDRVLALKVMHPSLAADASFVERFIREAKSAARLDHPNVVGVFDQGTDGSYVYLAMEYVSGCTLRDVLRERGALPVRAALDILEPVLAALGAAHRAGFVHRDMKPENVLIGDDGRVKVADFGLVRAVDAVTHTTGTVLGTVSYLAPEQIEEGTASPRVDVYACGVMLYEMLTGAKPHQGETPAQVLYRHVNEDVPPPSAVVPDLAVELDELVAAATARTPEDRPADAVALLARVREARGRHGREQRERRQQRRRCGADRGDEVTGAELEPRPEGVGHRPQHRVGQQRQAQQQHREPARPALRQPDEARLGRPGVPHQGHPEHQRTASGEHQRTGSRGPGRGPQPRPRARHEEQTAHARRQPAQCPLERRAGTAVRRPDAAARRDRGDQRHPQHDPGPGGAQRPVLGVSRGGADHGEIAGDDTAPGGARRV